jgi:hypothetical protein
MLFSCAAPARESVVIVKKAFDVDTAAPETDTLAPEADTTAPETETTAPETETTVPEADTTAPETETTAPETDVLVLETDAVPETDEVVRQTAMTYVLNKNTKKFHRPDCRSAAQIKEKNRAEFTGDREELIAQGYSPCKICNP